jgi:hypothetical protein
MIKTPMLHWGQGTMFKALAHLLSTSSPKKNVRGKSVLSATTSIALKE